MNVCVTVRADMLSVESVPVAEQEEVVMVKEEEDDEEEDEEEQQQVEVRVEDSGCNKLSDVYTLVAKGCFPLSMSPLRRKNLRRYAQKFVIDGEKKQQQQQQHCVSKTFC